MSLVSDGATLFATPFINTNASLSALTFFAWIKYPSSFAGSFNLIGLHSTSGAGSSALVKFNSGNDNGGGVTDDAGHFLFSVETGFSPEANTWEPLCCVVANNGSVTLLTPRASTSNTTSSGAVGTTTWNQIQVLGQQASGGAANAFIPSGGMLAECAVWLTALSSAEQKELVFGQVSPQRVRPTQLLCYLPLRRNVQDYGPLHMPFAATAGGTGTTFSGDHPIYGGPRSQQRPNFFLPGTSTAHSLALSLASTEASSVVRASAARRGVASPQFVLRTVVPGRSFSAADANVAVLGTIRSHHSVSSAADAQVAASIRKYSHGLLGSAASPNVAAVAPIGKLYPSVMAAVNASRALLFRIIGKAPLAVAEGETVGLNFTYGKSYATSAGSAAGLRRSTGLRRGVASTQSPTALRALARLFGAGSGQAVSRLLSAGKRLAVASAEAVSINRAFPFHISAASTETAAVAMTGGNKYFRILSVAASQTILLVRGLVAKRGAVTPQVASLTRTLGKLLTAADTGTAAVARQSNRAFGAVSTNVGGLVRQLGILRQAVSTQSAAVLPAALHHLAALVAVLLQVAARSGSPARWNSLSAADTNVAALSSHPTKTLPSVLSAASGQAVALLKNIGKILAISSAEVIGMRHGIGRAALSLVSIQSTNIGRLIGKLFATASTEATLAAVQHQIPSTHGVASSEATFLTPAINRVFAVASAQVQALRRGVAKMLPLAFVMRVSSGRGGQKAFAVTSPNQARSWTPHGKILNAFSTQVPRVTPWYHLFVPAWAYQQQTYLPPLGGPAEPPAFGPIDPADQTTFAFDWSRRLSVNDPIISAAVTSVPPGLSFAGPVFVQGQLVQATVAPFMPQYLPTIYSLRCSVVTASGRRSSFSIPVPVRTL